MLSHIGYDNLPELEAFTIWQMAHSYLTYCECFQFWQVVIPNVTEDVWYGAR